MFVQLAVASSSILWWRDVCIRNFALALAPALVVRAGDEDSGPSRSLVLRPAVQRREERGELAEAQQEGDGARVLADADRAERRGGDDGRRWRAAREREPLVERGRGLGLAGARVPLPGQILPGGRGLGAHSGDHAGAAGHCSLLRSGLRAHRRTVLYVFIASGQTEVFRHFLLLLVPELGSLLLTAPFEHHGHIDDSFSSPLLPSHAFGLQ